ncbi:hypothetical protein [Pseudoclavibacter helvolus]|uniref:hypothetical protein n=1 Tax=Pseudoclavibacter helvolus TaxID=255205 RepID=UPI000838A774|nr:hypothetical protein [Pseudoclavibacter helvolus]
MTGAQTSGPASAPARSDGEGSAARDLIKKLAGVGAFVEGFVVTPLESAKSVGDALGKSSPAHALSEAIIAPVIAVPKGVVGALNMADDAMKVVDAWKNAPVGASKGKAALAASSALLNDLSAVASGLASVTPLFAPTLTVPLRLAATTVTLAGGLIKGANGVASRPAGAGERQAVPRLMPSAASRAAAPPPSGPVRSVQDLQNRLAELMAALTGGRAQLLDLLGGRIKPLRASIDAYLQGSSRSSYRQATRSVEEATEALIVSAGALEQARLDVQNYRKSV